MLRQKNSASYSGNPGKKPSLGRDVERPFAGLSKTLTIVSSLFQHNMIMITFTL